MTDPGVSHFPSLRGARVVLGVCGGIAAYKAVEVCRRLVDQGAHVFPVLTEAATRFVGPTTFSALGSERTQLSLWDEEHPIPHTRLGQMADVVLVAPATADLLGRLACGLADDLLSATLLATRAPVIVAPAMHSEMLEHPAVASNIAVLKNRGVLVVEAGVGRLAGGDEGPGRLADTEKIVSAVATVLLARRDTSLQGVNVLVSAGGTREPIDSVRFIGNRSSGKQGHALAEEAAARGANVTLVTASSLAVSEQVEAVRVNTASDMWEALRNAAPGADVVLMAAAVADFRPAHSVEGKIRRASGKLELELEATPDILATLGEQRRDGQLLVGFAAETGELLQGASEKLRSKGVDLVVANDVSAEGAGFDGDTNAVTIVGPEGVVAEVPLASKATIASAVLDVVAARLHR